MKNTENLNYLSEMNQSDLDSLWQNNFNSSEKLNHINEFVPYPITNKSQIETFLKRQQDYNAWLIQRKVEKDVIGFIIYGNYFPGQPNNFGITIGLNFVRKGYAKESFHALMNHLKEKGLKEVNAHCFENNRAARAIMEICGMQNMGRTGKTYNANYELNYKFTF